MKPSIEIISLHAIRVGSEARSDGNTAKRVRQAKMFLSDGGTNEPFLASKQFGRILANDTKAEMNVRLDPVSGQSL
jgi:hypothetical protein